MQQSFIYITTNFNKTVLYTGVTSDLKRRLFEHENDANSGKLSFAGRYNCYHLIYYEEFIDIKQAIAREKEIKGWIRKKKIDLVNSFNPTWEFLNDKI